MGNCVPVQKTTDQPDINVKCSINSQGNSVQTGSPINANAVKDQNPTVELNSMAQSSTPLPYVTSLRGLSGNDEMYFDSQPWLESDCEDFTSVNGDLTPSHGNTPVHNGSPIDTPQHDDNTPNPSNPELSTADMKKQLIELFRESFGSEPVDGDQNLQGNGLLEAKPFTFSLPPANSSPDEPEANSGCNGERTPKRSSNYSSQCCLPNFSRSMSFWERKKRLNPAYSGGQ